MTIGFLGYALFVDFIFGFLSPSRRFISPIKQHYLMIFNFHFCKGGPFLFRWVWKLPQEDWLVKKGFQSVFIGPYDISHVYKCQAKKNFIFSFLATAIIYQWTMDRHSDKNDIMSTMRFIYGTGQMNGKLIQTTTNSDDAWNESLSNIQLITFDKLGRGSYSSAQLNK